MPRFTLRRLLLAAAFLPPLMAAVWFCFDFGKVHAGSDENAVRKKLLAYTPRGTNAMEVMEFVVNDLHRPSAAHGEAYERYVKEYRALTGRKDDFNLWPLGENDYTHERTIEVAVSGRAAGLLVAHVIEATWHFDDQDRLVDITTNSYGIGL